MILATQKDGTSVALNVDRIERIERNPVSRGRGSNISFAGGGHLIVEESQEALIELVVEAKAQVQAKALGLAAERNLRDNHGRPRTFGTPQLRMMSDPEPTS
jgi:uncharacterized protein YlzI (FlbEa/FlbD family)